MKTERIIRGTMVAAAGAIVFVTMLTLVGDMFIPFKDTLKSIFYHHWLGKGALAILFFVFAAPALSYLSPSDEENLSSVCWVLIAVSIFMSVVLFIFFIMEFFHLIYKFN